MSESTAHKKISVVFVLGDGVDKVNVSNDMKAAHQCCADQEVSTAWISCEECFKLNPKKTDIFVFDEFTGKAFDFLKDFKCVIIGPRCLMTCLLERKPIPNIPSPMISIAMVGVVATATGFTKEKKKTLSEKIGMMGGIYLNAFNASVTHLIADAVGSQKYKVAVERKVPIMTEDWVNTVWEAGLTENVSALDPQFSHHKLLAFQGIVVCASQISKKDKQNLMKLITSGGGQYSPQLEAKETGVLVIGDPSGTKFTYAKKWGIPCVTTQWVYDSSCKGFCLPFDSYAVNGEASTKALCSTPEAGKTQDALPDFSMCSTIAGDISRFNVNETVNTDFSAVPEPRTPRKGNGGSKDYIDLVNKLDVSEAKKAGSFLDGCKIYLSGFSPSQVEKLRKIINGGGATRFHQITESVSHVIVGEFLYEEIKSLKSGKFRPFVVRVDWLLESMRLGRVADEEKFLCFDLKPLEQPSPLSKKGLQLLQGGPPSASPMVPVKMARLETRGSEDGGEPLSSANEKELVEKYLGSGNSPEKSSAVDPVLNQENDDDNRQSDLSNKEVAREDGVPETSTAPPGKLFHGLKFVVAGFDGDPDDEDAGEEIRQLLTELGGQVMVRRFRGIPDYGIVPIEGGQLPCTVGEVITPLWLEDCNDQGKIVPVEYYHRPFVVEPDSRPLQGCVIGISTYSGKERLYISSLAETLGAYSQEVFSKKDIPEKNAVASTHLICPTPEGNKYAAALKWGLPAVTKDWILNCAQKGQKVPEADYYVVKAADKPPDENTGNSGVGSDVVKPTVLEEKSTSSVSAISKSNVNITSDKSENNASNMERTRQLGISENRQSVEPLMAPASTSMSARVSGGGNGPPSEKSLSSKVDHLRTVEGEVFTPPSRFSRVYKTPDVAVSVRDEDDVLKDNGASMHCEEFPGDVGGGEGEDEVKAQRLQSTPGTPYGQVFEANPSRSTRKAWKNWVETIPKLHQPTPPRIEKKPETPLSELKRRLWASIDNACKKMEMQLDSEEISSESGPAAEGPGKRKRPVEPEESSKKGTKPFAGVVAYIWKEFPKAKREQLAEKVEALGGIIQHSFNDIVTHAIFQGEECESSDEYRLALESGKMLVAPAWVELCAAEGMHKDEALFPPTDYPLRCSGETPVDWETLKSKSQALSMAPCKLPNKKPDVAWECNHEAKVNQLHESSKPFRKPEVHMQLKKLDSVLAEETQSTPEKVRLSRAASNAASWEDRVNPFPDTVGGGHMAHRSPRASGGYYSMGNPPSPSTQGSGSEVISWQENGMIDEGKRETRIRSKSKTTEHLEPESEERIPPKFMFSSMDEAEKIRYKTVVESLGGQVCMDTNFDTSATHLITLRPARSEKLLGSIASGIWVLHPKYLDASKSEGKFVEEELYEWGNPNGLVPVPTVEIERILSAAIHRWRVKIKGQRSREGGEARRGAFEGVCAIVHMVEERAAAFRRLIVAGGGTISEAKPPYTSATDATICLMEPGRSPGTTVDVESLAKKGIHCLRHLYINECLMRVETPDPLECAIPDYLAALQALKE